MRYLSLFSGIGGFEVAIHRVFPNAVCVGYSEIREDAIQVYEKHFPTHTNLGDITKITDYQLRKLRKNGCDLVVGGFPCTNLSSMAHIRGDNRGLQGPQSGLFYQLLRVLKVVKPRHFVIENNASMATKYRDEIGLQLSRVDKKRPVYMRHLDAQQFGVQTRKRLFWTTFEVPAPDAESCGQTWDDVLLPVGETGALRCTDTYVECMNRPASTRVKKLGKVAVRSGHGGWDFEVLAGHDSRWDKSTVSDTMQTQVYTPYPVGKCRPLVSHQGGNSNLLIDRRGRLGDFVLRSFSATECERMFYYEDDYTLVAKYKTTRYRLLGNSVVVRVVEHVIQCLDLLDQGRQ